MQKRDIKIKGDVVMFAQLLGMRDHIAFILGEYYISSNPAGRLTFALNTS